MGEGARRCAHPSRLSTWQLQFASPSLTLHLRGACCGAEPRPTRGRGSPVGASGSPTQAPARGWGPQGPLSRSSDTQEGAHSPSSLWSWWAGLGEGAKPPKAVTPSPTDRKGRSTSLERVSLSRKGDAGALPHTLREGMRSGPQAPRPLGRCCVGGGGRGGDSAALRLPPCLPGTLQQLEPPLLQEPKAFVPQCQGCQGKREAGRLPLPGGTQARPHCLEDFQPSGSQRFRVLSL